MIIVTKEQFETISEMKEFLSNKPKPALLLGEDGMVQNAASAYLMQYPNGREVWMAVITEGYGFQPQILLKQASFFVGYNSQIAFVNENARIAEIIWGGSVFFEFAASKNTNIIIAVFEACLIRLNISGEILWRISTDINVGTVVKDDCIEVMTETGVLHVDIATGIKK